MIVILLILIALDVVTTLAILRKGGRELNPVLGWLMARLGAVPALLVTHGLLAAGVLFCPLFADPVALVMGVVIYGALLVNNVLVLRKL